MGEFLKGYVGKMAAEAAVRAGYAQDGDSCGLTQACGEAMCFQGAAKR